MLVSAGEGEGVMLMLLVGGRGRPRSCVGEQRSVTGQTSESTREEARQVMIGISFMLDK